MPRLHQRMPVQKHPDSYVLLQPGQPDDFRNHLYIALCPDVKIIAAMRDGIGIYLISVIFAVGYRQE